MKKLFKKSIACLIAILMVFSTVPMVVFATVDMNVKTGISISGYENAYGAMYYNNQKADYAFSVLKEVGSDGVITVAKGQSFTITQSFGTWSSKSNTAVGDTALASSGLHWHYGSGTEYNISSQSADDTLCKWRATLEGSDTAIQSGDVTGTLANNSPQDKFRSRASEGGTNEATGIYTFTPDSFSQLNTPGTYKIQLHSALAFNQWMKTGGIFSGSKWWAVYATSASSASDGNLMTNVYIPVTVRVVDNYSFVNAAGTTVKTVQATSATEAYNNKPANTAISYTPNNNGTHNIKIYSWPKSPNGTTFNETYDTVNNEICSGGTATCTTKKVCQGCGVEYGDVDSNNHTGLVSMSGKDATCSEDGYSAYQHCNDCGADVGKNVIPATNHSWGDWTSISDTQHKRVCANDPSHHVETEQHNIVNGACTKCDYVAFDMATYNSAVKEYEEIIGAGDYAEKYTEASRTAYQEAVEAAKRDSFATKEEVDAAVAAILSAKTKLVYAQPEIKFVEVDANGNETVIETKNYTYGTPVEFTKNADNIAKWIVKTQNGNVETKVATSQTTYTMIATEPATVYVHLTEEKTEAVQYSKVSFISKNGAVSFVKYVPAGTTLYTNTVDGVEIPFYEFKNWDKASVTADGSNIEVKAVYEFVGEETNKCNVHYNGTTKTYTYDSFVYLFGAEDKTLALSTDGTVENIITYLNENAFYAPHTADIYVIEVNSPQPASIGITGSYASSTDTKKTAAFNCKFFLPAGCTVVEYGLTATSSTGKSMKIKAEAASARGEYCVKVSMAKTSSVTSVEGVAYLTYKDAENYLHTIYSTPVTQNL